MSLRGRLRRLADTARRRGLYREGCPACRERKGRIVLVDRLEHGGASPPSPCPACGQVPEFIIEVVEPVVGEGAPQP